MKDIVFDIKDGAEKKDEVDRKHRTLSWELRQPLQMAVTFKSITDMNLIWARGRPGVPKKAYDGFASFCLELTY